MPCEEPHDNEVYAFTPLAGNPIIFPGDAAAAEAALTACLDRFDGFVGAPFPTSALDILYITPTSEGWAEGDKSVICAVFRVDGQPLIGTAEGSGL